MEQKLIKIPNTKFGTIEADIIDNKLVVNSVYHCEKYKWDLTYKGYDLWKYDMFFAVYHKDNKFIGYGLNEYNFDDNGNKLENIFVEVQFSKRPNRTILKNESPIKKFWSKYENKFAYYSNSNTPEGSWNAYNLTTYNYDKINDAFINGKFYEILTDAQKLERDKKKEENWDKATCGACHRLIQLDGDRIWDHGYTMQGWRQNSCTGKGYRSWEHSPEGKIALIKSVKYYVENSKTITRNEIAYFNAEIEEAQRQVDNWKPAKTPRELQEVVQ